MYYKFIEFLRHIASLRDFDEFARNLIQENPQGEKELKDSLACNEKELESDLILYNKITNIERQTLLDLLSTFLSSIGVAHETTESSITIEGEKIELKEQPNIYEDIINNETIKKYPVIIDVFMHYLDCQTYYLTVKTLNVSNKNLILYIKNYFVLKNNKSIKNPYKVNEALANVLLDQLDILSSTDVTEEELDLFNRILNGEYNKLGEPTSFVDTKLDTKLDFYEILDYAKKREENKTLNLNDITVENYMVFKAYKKIISLTESIIKTGKNYIPLSGLYQTPPTKEELNEITSLMNKVLTNNYNWREAREIYRQVGRLNIHHDEKFPHNINEILTAFNPEIITFYDKIDNYNLTYEIGDLKKLASELIQEINENGIVELFTSVPKNYLEAYLRRMMLSMIDFEFLIDRNSAITSEDITRIREELINGTTISSDTLAMLIRSENKEAIIELVIGILNIYADEKPITDIFNECKNIQKHLNCNKGSVGFEDINQLTLPNGETIIGTYYEDIKEEYQAFTDQYNYYFNNTSDGEFVEGCVEIMGNVIMSRIFNSGNKRTGKCLFIRMLLSRNIIPPVLDLNEKMQEVFEELAYDRKKRFVQTRYKAILQCADVLRQFKEKNFHEPLQVNGEKETRKKCY